MRMPRGVSINITNIILLLMVATGSFPWWLQLGVIIVFGYGIGKEFFRLIEP